MVLSYNKNCMAHVTLIWLGPGEGPLRYLTGSAGDEPTVVTLVNIRILESQGKCPGNKVGFWASHSGEINVVGLL